MSLSYFNVKKFRRQSKQAEQTEETVSQAVDAALGNDLKSPPAPTTSEPSKELAAEPVLDEEDEKFLARLTQLAQEPEGQRPPLPARPTHVIQDGEKQTARDAQGALMDGAEKVPLPTSPSAVPEPSKDGGLARKKSVMSYFTLAQARIKKATTSSSPSVPTETEKQKDKGKKPVLSTKDAHKAADDLLLAAHNTKTPAQKKEDQELTALLDDLNLAAVNNRVFSFSAESEALFAKFTLVLKDIIAGGPTAYNDLEQLFTDYEATLKKMYAGLPPFLQSMVQSLPAKMTAALGPEVLAAAAEKPGFDGKQQQKAAGTWQETAKGYAKKKAKQKAGIPSLKSLLSAEGAIATMLRSILNFLKLRFPAVLTGTNIVMSLAVCLLLFVLWYCHKRGRETRLEAASASASTTLDPSSSTSPALASSSASSLASQPDSIFAPRAPAPVTVQQANATQPPLVISDETGTAANRATVDQMPSVSGLPSPGEVVAEKK